MAPTLRKRDKTHASLSPASNSHSPKDKKKPKLTELAKESVKGKKKPQSTEFTEETVDALLNDTIDRRNFKEKCEKLKDCVTYLHEREIMHLSEIESLKKKLAKMESESDEKEKVYKEAVDFLAVKPVVLALSKKAAKDAQQLVKMTGDALQDIEKIQTKLTHPGAARAS
ncbi:OLC1v1038489C1 [Oldenlandia corymbosa var. corymbosa]|uniref:OLC1v1038489C1 n=1 Tax=Oldenlandia corymbosa var. corymbosa TaxID=529605 RepID=A0AAV1D3P4_OLDCO|nr:OLC1v1038489C1 [Oldenlandia corymbosa var. corymbosa]